MRIDENLIAHTLDIILDAKIVVNDKIFIVIIFIDFLVESIKNLLLPLEKRRL